MNYNKIQADLGNRNYFPNTSTVAYFSPNSQTIHLNHISQADIAKRDSAADYAQARSEIATIFHEITHWADLVGTVWGRKYLSTIYEAFRLLENVEKPDAEYDFWKFTELHDEGRRLMLPEYYRTVRPDSGNHDHRKPWGIQFSAGREFDSQGNVDDSRPVLFVKFLNRDSGEQIIRQPLTVGALLEANAVWSEMTTEYEVVATLDDGVRQVEQTIMDRARLETLYTNELTLYTSPAHLLANYARVSDVFLGYRLASAVAHLTLNLTEELYELLVPPASMAPWGNMFEEFKARRNPSFAYAVICACAEEWNDNIPLEAWMNTALSAAGLPTSEEIMELAHQKMIRQTSPEVSSRLGQTQEYLLKVGLIVFETRRNKNDPSLTFGKALATNLPTPPLFDADGNVCMTTGSTFDLNKFDPTEMHDSEWALDKWTRNFLSSCR